MEEAKEPTAIVAVEAAASAVVLLAKADVPGAEEKDIEDGGIAGNNVRGDEGVLAGVAIGDTIDDDAANISDSDDDVRGHFTVRCWRNFPPL